MKIVDLRDCLKEVAVNRFNEGNDTVAILACDTLTMLDLFIQRGKANRIPVSARHNIEWVYIDNHGSYKSRTNILLMLSIYVNLRMKYNDLLAEEKKNNQILY